MSVTCVIHPEGEATGLCAECGKPHCSECLVQVGAVSYCKTCLAGRLQRPVRPISGFGRFVLSMIPGLGHLYMGLFNRGFQVMAAAVAGAVVGIVLRAPIVLFWILGCVAYSIFDAREAHLRIVQGLEVRDQLLFDWKFNWNNKWVAYALVGFGLLLLYRSLVHDLLSYLLSSLRIYGGVIDSLDNAMLGVLSLAAGAWLLRGGPRSGKGDQQ